MDRRRFLAATGSGVSLLLAGCRTTETVPDTETTLELGETYETVAGETITAANVHIHRSALYALDGYPPQVLVLPDRQLVFLTLLGTEPDAVFCEAGSFQLLLDDERYRGATEVGDDVELAGVSLFHEFVHVPSPTDEEQATVAWEVPLDVASERVAVEWVGDDTTARWDWPDSRVRALRNPSRFRVEALDLPETFACDEPFGAAVRVANDGGRQGLFNAVVGPPELGRHHGWEWMSLRVPAGETAIWAEELQYPPSRSDLTCDERTDSATFELDWGIGTRTATSARRGTTST